MDGGLTDVLAAFAVFVELRRFTKLYGVGANWLRFVAFGTYTPAFDEYVFFFPSNDTDVGTDGGLTDAFVDFAVLRVFIAVYGVGANWLRFVAFGTYTPAFDEYVFFFPSNDTDVGADGGFARVGAGAFAELRGSNAVYSSGANWLRFVAPGV